MLASLLVSAMLTPAKSDWLIKPDSFKAAIKQTANEVVLTNGLITRVIKLSPDAATISIKNHMTSEEMLRAVKPEAVLTLNGKEYPVGGLVGQKNLAFLLPEWISELKANPVGFHYVGHSVGQPVERMKWKQVRSSAKGNWPPKGVALTMDYESPAFPGLEVAVHYELYDGLPAFQKWFTISNQGSMKVNLDKFICENIGFVESDSVVDATPAWRVPNVAVFSDYAFGGMAETSSNKTTYWVPDSNYKTQVNYELKTPCDLEVRPPVGPDFTIEPKKDFESFRAFVLIQDSADRERRGLAMKTLYRTVAPWITENPIMLHLTSVDPVVVHRAIDQAAECGFEMIVISFWSGLDMENQSQENLDKFKAFRAYANSKGIELGGYSLLASRHVDAENDIVNPKPIFGASPCLESKWGQNYFRTIQNFFEKTGFNLFEHDGSYPGDTCASEKHPGHKGFADSQWMQWRRITDYYKWCRSQGIYLNVPDNYFLAGSNKTGMGYRESNWSLPRAQQHIHARQNLFDGTWEKTPSMGWMMTPLVEYQGGGKEATIEPLSEHLDDYQMHLMNNFGYGAQSCYRGPRIYDTETTKAAVIKWVTWFKKHRDILESDVIHIRRPDGRNLDGIVHVNPKLKTPAMALIYNPTAVPRTETMRIPLYYSGLKGQARGALGDTSGRQERPHAYNLDGNDLELEVTVPARGCTWLVFEK
ncbi:MAG: alpha-galactosidase [Fimbriimonadaceae bacterium]